MRLCFGSTRYFRAILCVTCLVMVGYGLPAMAQEAEEELTPEQQLAMEQAVEKSFEEEITVTGSLIPRPTLEAMSPVTTIEPEEITYSGTIRVEDLVMELPQVFSVQNATIANGASGTATVGLRHMGPVRTLVLINGRRMPPGDAWAISASRVVLRRPTAPTLSPALSTSSSTPSSLVSGAASSTPSSSMTTTTRLRGR